MFSAAIRPYFLDNTPARYTAVLLVVIWLIAMARLFWYFEAQRMTSSQQLFHFDARDLPSPPSSSLHGAKVVYFIPRGCRCNAAALAEILRLQKAAGSRLSQFVIADDELPSTLVRSVDTQALAAQQQMHGREVMPLTPAAAFWNDNGELIYFGPIILSTECGAVSSNLISVWNRILNKTTTAFTSSDVVACACTPRSTK